MDKKDLHVCNIEGMAVTSNGTILLADYNNDKIKSVTPDGNLLSVVSLPEHSGAVTDLNATTAVAADNSNNKYIR